MPRANTTSLTAAATIAALLLVLPVSGCGSSSVDLGTGNGSENCESGKVDCGGNCVDLALHADNCGKCGNKCSAGQVCSASTCKLSCDPEFTTCGSACANTQSNTEHCGSCGHACESGQLCYLAKCLLSCPSDSLQCGQTCCDSNNEVCSNNVCMPKCVTGTTCGTGTVCDSNHQCVEGCYIDGVLYEHGAACPTNPCETCSETHTTQWSINRGAPCGAGHVCNANGACIDGCFIDGNQYAHGNTSPSNPCETCTAEDTSAWTGRSVGTDCGSGRVCYADRKCVDGCYIDGTLRSRGDVNPANPCEFCSVSSTSAWTRFGEGVTCGTGQVCDITGTCIGGCVIGGNHYAIDARNPLNPCESCSESNGAAWTGLALGAECGTGRVCEAERTCVDGCYIDGSFRSHGALNPSNPCEACAADSTSSWTSLQAWTECGPGLVCNARGECVSTCVDDVVVAEAAPLDIYLMLDRSLSMSGTKWTNARSSISGYVQSNDAKGHSFALAYFPTSNSSASSCSTCTVLGVPMGNLPDIVPSILTSLNSTIASGYDTPTSCALKNMVQFTKDNARPGYTMIGIFVTDGAPVGCSSENTDSNLRSIVETHYADTKIHTFMVGMTGASFTKLEYWADYDGAIVNTSGTCSGTSCHHYNVGDGDPTTFSKALQAIQESVSGCTFKLPDLSGVSASIFDMKVEYDNGGALPAIDLPYFPSASDCSGGGWYLDDPAYPDKMELCSDSCAALKADSSAAISIRIPCSGT